MDIGPCKIGGCYQIVRGNTKVELEWIGEGWEGDYDPTDPDDKRLLRFSVARFIDGEWQDVDDSSYCTQIPADAGDEVIYRALAHIESMLPEDGSIKKLCERLSWISPEDFPN
jgi:hypothetical protein